MPKVTEFNLLQYFILLNRTQWRRWWIKKIKPNSVYLQYKIIRKFFFEQWILNIANDCFQWMKSSHSQNNRNFIYFYFSAFLVTIKELIRQMTKFVWCSIFFYLNLDSCSLYLFFFHSDRMTEIQIKIQISLCCQNIIHIWLFAMWHIFDLCT